MTCDRCGGRGEIEDLGGGIPCPQCRPVFTAAFVALIEAERAALLAQRDRYEAALREIAKGDCHLNGITGCKGWPLPRERWCGLCVAREALAAAQEGTGLDLGGPPDCVDGTDNSGAVGGAAAQEGTP
jgi:hypothetical protein